METRTHTDIYIYIYTHRYMYIYNTQYNRSVQKNMDRSAVFGQKLVAPIDEQSKPLCSAALNQKTVQAARNILQDRAPCWHIDIVLLDISWNTLNIIEYYWISFFNIKPLSGPEPESPDWKVENEKEWNHIIWKPNMSRCNQRTTEMWSLRPPPGCAIAAMYLEKSDTTKTRWVIVSQLVGGWAYASEKYESQLGLLFPTCGKWSKPPTREPEHVHFIIFLYQKIMHAEFQDLHCLQSIHCRI